MAINKRKILESAQKNLQKGLVDKALEDYRTLLRADPHDANVLLKVGDLHLKQGKREESINAYLRVAQQFTRDGFDAKAVALYKQISRLDPKRHDVCVPLADLYARMGLTGDAIASLQTAADAAYRAGEKDDALELLRRMAALDPSNTPNRLKVAELLAQEGRAREALAEYEAVAEELERRGEVEERIRVVERILAVDPERGPALREVARAKLAMNQFGAAQRLAEQLIAAHAEDVEGYEILGHALLGAGESEQAREVFRDLAERFRLRGDEDRARDLMQRFGGLEALSPEGTETPLDSGEGVLELDSAIGGDDEFLLDEEPLALPPTPEPAKTTPIGRIEPVATLKRAPAPRASEAPAVVQAKLEPAATDPASTDPDQLLAEATVYLRYGKHERAVGALRAILAREPEHRAALEHLAEALTALGEGTHAATAWQRAAEAANRAGDAEGFERLRARLAALDAGAAAALVGPALAPEADEPELALELEAGFEAEARQMAAPAEPPLEIGDTDGFEFSDELEGLEAGEGASEAAPAPPAPAAPGPERRATGAPSDEDPTATTPAQLSEQLEEAEFYLEQGLVDEARGLYERILAAAPNHPQALLRLGEIAAKSGQPIPASKPAAAVPVKPEPTASKPAEPEPAASKPAEPIAPKPAEPQAPAPAPDQPAGFDFGEEIELALDEDDATPVSAERAPAGAASQGADETPAPEPALAVEDPGAFDLAAELALGIAADEPAVATLAGTEEEGFEQVFNAFKSGVERELGEGDHEARYDLGIAYKEMGLLEDAIGEFRLAMEAEARRLSCLHMMGLCALELGRSADAVSHLEQALSLPDLPDDQRVPLRYDLGRAYAARGDVARARAAFEAVQAVDPDFGELARELAALAGRETEAPSDEDGTDAEAYESFDDLLGEGPQEEATPRYESFDDLFAEGSDEPAPAPDTLAADDLAAPPEPDHAPAAPDEPEPQPEPEAGPAPSDAPAAREAESPEASPKRKRRKISFV